ncbi:MAG: hypothetical protein OHK0039_26680 [Bacteroidia bacterium]
MKLNHMLWTLAAMILFAACATSNTQEAAAETETAAEPVAMVYPADSISPDSLRSFHGLRIDEAGAVPIVQLVELVGTQGGSLDQVKIEGTIEACCQAKGCWMTMKLANDEDMRIRFRDYGFFVPKDAAGKTAVVEGRAYYDTTSVEELRHYAVDGGMDEKEAEATYTEPKVTLAFEATGVVIKGSGE